MERAIFQPFWKLHCVTKSLFFELETPNFGSSYVFSSLLNLQGQILPNLKFWTQKWHISLKSRYHYSKAFVSWDKCMTWNMRFLTFKCQVRKNLTHLSSWAHKNMAVAKILYIYLKRQRFWNNGTWILPETCMPFLGSNVKLVKIWPRQVNGLEKTNLEPNFGVSSSKNKIFDQQCNYQKVWKIALLSSG